MADRKVLVKYYPPDFDPEKLARKSRLYRHKDEKRNRYGVKLMNVRFMFPFTMCCSNCNEFIYIGTKFNSRVEKIRGMDYLGISLWRFYGRCPHCRGEIKFRTDPQNTEYILESGGIRTYDPKKDAEIAEITIKEQLEEQIATDAMKALEHRTHNTANELLALEQLDELRKINRRFLSREATHEKVKQWLESQRISKEEMESELVLEEDLLELRQAKQEMSDLKFQQLERRMSSDSSPKERTTPLAHPDTAAEHVVSLAPSTSTDVDHQESKSSPSALGNIAQATFKSSDYIIIRKKNALSTIPDIEKNSSQNLIQDYSCSSDEE